MTALGRLFRTTAFKLAAIYFAVFTALAAFLIVYIAQSTSQILNRQLVAAIDGEVRALEEEYRDGGLRGLVDAIESRSRRPGASLYLIGDLSGRFIAGNVGDVPVGVLVADDGEPRPVRYARLDEPGNSERRHLALVRVFAVEGGFHVLVGRDIGEREEFRAVVRRALRVTIVVMVALALLTWLFVSRRVLRRVSDVAQTSARIVAGDLSGRLAVTGTGDEFDRLAESLNTMLARIDELLRGMKEVSDNIAHDLKTPLTRLRNRVEAALAGPPSAERYREALEATIEESDALIRTFDALLRIARVEAGSAGAEMTELDLSEVAREVGELYEPVAEEAGVRFAVDAPEPAPIVGNRELLAQALANLVDNALKYGRAPDRSPAVEIRLRAGEQGVELSVCDNGPGVPTADRERVVGRFVRLEASRNAPGSGLGLSLVQAVARLHGADLILEDAEPGLRVVLRFPEHAARSPRGASHRAESSLVAA